MSTVISIMDRNSWEANTDNIVVANRECRSLCWVPRDLWSELLQDRINAAFKTGGHTLLINALSAFGLKVSQSICGLPDAVERCISGLSVPVPVISRLAFSYPLEKHRPIQEGSKIITFSPPLEILSGERIHQWIGARFREDGKPGSDFRRIERQKTFVLSLLNLKADFSRFLGEYASVSAGFKFDDLREISPEWQFETFLKGKVQNVLIKDKYVLVPTTGS